MSETSDLVIVGGGAAGLAAAIFAAETAGGAKRIVLLEGSRQCGTKILASGGGRCNVTHEKVTPDDFFGSRNIVRNVLVAFDAEATVQWFAAMGVQLKREETGKLFPVSDSAHTVLDVLMRRCSELGVQIETNARVIHVSCSGTRFDVGCSDQRLWHAAEVILATGGKSLPKSGSDGLGWEIVKQLGHTVTSTHQALAPLVLDSSFFHADLSGITLDAELSTFVEGKRVDHRRGSLLWTHFGVSGPVVMDASRFWAMAKDGGKAPELRCGLLPGTDFEQADRWLMQACAERPKASLQTIVATRLPEKVALCVLVKAGLGPVSPAGQLSREGRRALAHALTDLVLPVTQPRGWDYAEVTAGGVPLSEINFRTMESRKMPGLYLVGEILDCDGRIGGFNFQWAWSTGHVAGRAAGRKGRATHASQSPSRIRGSDQP